uniref:Uncharacterized protein n=1 Tax=Alexandrium monilatum TaxID=311494 RepID=A0A7S4V2H1_9DINO
MQGGEALSGVADTFGEGDVLDDEEDCACCVEETEAEDVGCYDEEDLLVAPAEGEAEEGAEEEDDDEGPIATEVEEEHQPGDGTEPQESARPSKRRRRAPSSKARTAPAGTRLEELARPRQPRAEPSAESPKPAVQVPEKKPQTTRPSLLLRLRPTNLQEAMEAFFQSGFSEAPRFTYSFDEEYVSKHFQENSHVCFELLPEAKRILQRVQDEYGGPEAFMQRLYGEEKISAEDLRDIVATYLQEHNVEDKVEIRIVDNMLAAANVVKPSPDEKYVVNIARGSISKTMVQGICDHEVGTHLLRMMNDEYQVWHGRRDRYRLLNPWTTEEGFATLNTYITMPCKLLYPQALRYFAVCRGAQVGFVELFHELRQHVSDPKRCWQMCCRIKRGMIDTSQPGAFYMDQAYFKGAVEILRHVNEIDFGRLYAGQIALQDLDKVYFLLRKEVVRLPRFLNSAEKLKTYLAHCRRLIRENQIEAAVERVCKPVFIRAAKEFFKQKPKAELRATIAIGAPGLQQGPDGERTRQPARALDLSRLEDLARPRPAVPAETPEGPGEAVAKRRDCDLSRLAELAMPRPAQRAESEEPSGGRGASRAPDLARIGDLSRPRLLQLSSGPAAEAAEAASSQRREFSRARMLELAIPRPRAPNEAAAADAPVPPKTAPSQKQRAVPRRGASAPPAEGATRPPASADAGSSEDGSSLLETTGGALPTADSAGESGDEEAGQEAAKLRSHRKARRGRRRSRSKAAPECPPPPPPPPERPLHGSRPAAPAAPRKVCEEDASGQPCQCGPMAGGRRRRRSKLRLLALVQEKQARMEEQADTGESFLETSPRDVSPTADAREDADEAAKFQDDGPAAAPAARRVFLGLPPTPECSSSSAPGGGSRAHGIPSRPEPLQPQPEPPGRAAAAAARRAQSLGAVVRPAGGEVPAAADAVWRPLGGGAPAPLLSGPSAAGAAGQRAAGGEADPSPGAPVARRPRAASSLPRPSAILPRAAMAAMATMATGNSGPAWKAVPIRTMQLQLAV